jgi:hypothetical protein
MPFTQYARPLCLFDRVCCAQTSPLAMTIVHHDKQQRPAVPDEGTLGIVWTLFHLVRDRTDIPRSRIYRVSDRLASTQ